MPSNRIFINKKKGDSGVSPFLTVGDMLKNYDKQVEESKYIIVGFDFGSESTSISSFENKLGVLIDNSIFTAASAAKTDESVRKKHGVLRVINPVTSQTEIVDST